ncbi:hypothetical protein FB451DRAFT_1030618 [Mycena latifolia]|nr:hypothetical protein FB451DRAFT_1030618 [Mycena latifolia]
MFRTRSQLSAGLSAARPIYVQEYSLDAEESSELDLLRVAHAAAGHDTLWINRDDIFRAPARVISPSASITSIRVFFIESPVASFEFASGPPRSNTKRSPPNLKEWNADIDSGDDLFDINELEEFKNTDLSFLMLGAAKRSHSEEPVDDAEPPLKRRKLDVGSLGDIVPQPHVLPSAASTSAKTKSVPVYSKSKPIPIAPHTLPLPDTPPYSRRSWVIPVRGVLPWRHATSAVLLLDSTDPPEPPVLKTQEIVWTAPALSSFWSFLLYIRDIHALGLSFHVSQYFSSNSQPTYSEISGMGAQPLSLNSGAAPMVSSSHQGLGTVPLNFLDHIKVYHDAANSMRIRNILDAWAFEPGKAQQKIRLLKGARFVLLDERSKGILVS